MPLCLWASKGRLTSKHRRPNNTGSLSTRRRADIHQQLSLRLVTVFAFSPVCCKKQQPFSGCRASKGTTTLSTGCCFKCLFVRYCFVFVYFACACVGGAFFLVFFFLLLFCVLSCVFVGIWSMGQRLLVMERLVTGI